jgi:uncharacterized protein YndB with AHSA1/START domain
MVVVELAEGARIVGHMVRCTPEAMRFDLPVRVVFKRLTARVTLPVWRPTDDGYLQTACPSDATQLTSAAEQASPTCPSQPSWTSRTAGAFPGEIRM